MAHCKAYSSDLIVSNVPLNFSTSKLKVRLEDIGGRGSIEEIERIDNSTVKVVVDYEAQKKLMENPVAVAFGGEKYMLEIESLEADCFSSDTEDENDIFTFDAMDITTKAILRYLARTEQQKKSLLDGLKQFDVILIQLSECSILIRLCEGNRSEVRARLACYIKDFIAQFSSWTEKLEPVTPVIVRHIKSVLSQYQKKCFGRWFDDSSTILVTGPKDLVGEVENLVKKNVESGKTDLNVKSKAHGFEYNDVSPAVMRFVSRQAPFNKQFSVLLDDLGWVDITEKNKNLCVKITPKQKVAEWLHDDFVKHCNGRIKLFFDQFTTWKGKFDSGVLDMHRTRLPSLFKTQTFRDHFIQFHFDTGVVDVTGTLEQVNRCKKLIQSMMDPSKITSPRPPHPIQHLPMGRNQLVGVQPLVFHQVPLVSQIPVLVPLRNAYYQMVDSWDKKTSYASNTVVKERDYKIDYVTEEEALPPDIFIAQRECGVWKSVEEKCKNEGIQISIWPSEECKIVYRGSRECITRARKCLGEICEGLVSCPVEGLSEDHLEFVRICGASQRNIPKDKNLLDSVYQKFKESGVGGSLFFQPSPVESGLIDVHLMAVSEEGLQKGNAILREMVVDFELDPAQIKPAVPYGEFYSGLKEKLEGSPVYVKEQQSIRKIKLFCFHTEIHKIKQLVKQFENELQSVNDVEKFYPMSVMLARHICNELTACKIANAKSVKLSNKGGKYGVLVKYDKEDGDTVEMSLDDLQQEICKMKEHLKGYFLYEYLTGEGKSYLSEIEQQTNCSIFLKPTGQVETENFVSLKVGNILDEKCDSIVNVISVSHSMSGHVFEDLVRRFGQNVVSYCMHYATWIIPYQLCICYPEKCMPWKHIFNIHTPNDEHVMKNIISKLLRYADSRGIASLALSEIGTGIHPMIFLKSIKEAIAGVTEEKLAFLKGVRLIFPNAALLPLFKELSVKVVSKSTGANATIYGNDENHIKQAKKKMKEFCDQKIRTTTMRNAAFASVKSRIYEICNRYDVCLEWKRSPQLEECSLAGIADKVSRTEQEIKKLLESVPREKLEKSKRFTKKQPKNKKNRQ